MLMVNRRTERSTKGRKIQWLHQGNQQAEAAVESGRDIEETERAEMTRMSGLYYSLNKCYVSVSTLLESRV